MADIIFTDATLLSYNVENYFLGDGVARYGSTKRLTVEVMSYNLNLGGRTIEDNGDPGELDPDFNNEGVSETWDNLTTYLNNANNFENIIIKVAGDDWNLGKGIIESIGTTEQNPIRVGYHRFNIEIPDVNSTLRTFGGTSYKGIKEAFSLGDQELIRDFSESFNFSEDEDGKYTQDHSVSVRFEEGKSGVDEIGMAKSLAEELFSSGNAPPFGLAVRPGLYDDYVADKKHYFTETYDAFTKSCSFVKKLIIEDEEKDGYTYKLRHTTNLITNGTISVTEYCEIKGEDTYAQALVGMEAEILLASGRCTTVFTNNAKFLGSGGSYNGSAAGIEGATTSPAALNTGTTGLSRLNQAITISKQFNKRKKTVNYTITFNNDPTIGDNYIHEYSMNYTESQNGSLNISQNGRIRPYGQKTSAAFNSIKAYFTQIKNGTGSNAGLNDASFEVNAQNYYDELRDTSGPTSASLKPTATNVSFAGGKAGMEISYSKSHSDDLSLRYSYNVSSQGSNTPSAQNVPGTIKRINLSISDTAPQLIRSTFLIPNKRDTYQLLHEPVDGLGKQTNMGSRTVEIKALKARVDEENVFSTFPSLTAELNYLKQLALIKVAEVVPDLKLGKVDLFLDTCSYSFNNNRELTFKVTGRYATKSELDYTNINPTTIIT